MSRIATPTQSSSSNSTSGKSMTSGHTTQVPHEKIAKRAYEKWCQQGCRQGTDQQNWLEAEREIKAELSKSGTQSNMQTNQGKR